MNTIANLMQKMGVAVIIVGGILTFCLLPQYTTEGSIKLTAFVNWLTPFFICGITGLLMIGFGEVIELLATAKEEMREVKKIVSIQTKIAIQSNKQAQENK